MSSLPSSLTTFAAIPVAIAAAVLLGGCAASGSGTAPAPTAVPGLGAASTTSSTSSSTASTKPSATANPQAADPRRLLLTADDVTDADDRFTQRSRDLLPNNGQGASAFFVNDKDTRAISDTVTIYPDDAAATAALKQASATLPTLVTGGKPAPLLVGADGVLVRGRHPDGAKDVTLLFFTEGRALVRLEFQSATGDPTTDRFVTSIAKMQQIALRVGLANSP